MQSFPNPFHTPTGSETKANPKEASCSLPKPSLSNCRTVPSHRSIHDTGKMKVKKRRTTKNKRSRSMKTVIAHQAPRKKRRIEEARISARRKNIDRVKMLGIQAKDVGSEMLRRV